MVDPAGIGATNLIACDPSTAPSPTVGDYYLTNSTSLPLISSPVNITSSRRCKAKSKSTQLTWSRPIIDGIATDAQLSLSNTSTITWYIGAGKSLSAGGVAASGVAQIDLRAVSVCTGVQVDEEVTLSWVMRSSDLTMTMAVTGPPGWCVCQVAIFIAGVAMGSAPLRCDSLWCPYDVSCYCRISVGFNRNGIVSMGGTDAVIGRRDLLAAGSGAVLEYQITRKQRMSYVYCVINLHRVCLCAEPNRQSVVPYAKQELYDTSLSYINGVNILTFSRALISNDSKKTVRCFHCCWGIMLSRPMITLCRTSVMMM